MRRLAAAVGPGSTHAEWARLVARHHRTVWLSVVAMGVDPEVARDVVQATWAKLLSQIEAGVIVDIRWPGLAITQARFIALDELRRARMRRPANAALEEVPGSASDPQAHLLNREQLARAARALAGCSAQEQRVFRHVYEDPSRPHVEIAAEVGLSVQRVRQIICEVRKKVRAHLEEGQP